MVLTSHFSAKPMSAAPSRARPAPWIAPPLGASDCDGPVEL